MGTIDNSNTVLDQTGKKELYQNNLKALEKHHPDLVEQIESMVIEEDRVRILDTESGVQRVLYKRDDGQEVYIHNAEDPAGCANQAIDMLGKMENEGIAVLFGFGLGYFAEEIFERFEKGHMLMVYEATPALFKTALMTRDHSELLESEKVKILLGEGDHNLSLLHSHHHLLANGKFWVVKHHPSTKLNESAYEKFFKRLNAEKRLSDSDVATAIGLGKEFINTFLANIPSIMRKHGVNKLKDSFKGRPAIMVSAGPSLEKNFHLLKKAKGKAVIIAVDVVLPTLLPAGIIPDILVAIDPLPENIAVFKNNPLLKHVPFICLAQYTPEIVNNYPGPIFISGVPGNIIYQWLGGYWEDKGYVECFGGSVAHLGFATAEYIGADVIALIGQDLSFAKKLHAGDTTEIIHDHLKMKVPDFSKVATEAEDIFGEKVYSRITFLSFKTSLENRVKIFKGTVINATEGGLPIDKALPMRLIDFMDEYCDLPEIDTFSVFSELMNDSVQYNLDGMIDEVTAARDKFREIRKNSSLILKYIRKVRALKDQGQRDSSEVHNILDKVEALIEKVKHPILNIMVGYNYALELYLKRQDMIEIDELEDKWERLDRQLERGSKYYLEIVKTINLLNKQLEKLLFSLKRENEVNSILNDETVPRSERFSRIGMIYKKADFPAQAVRYLEMAINPESDENNQTQESGNTNELIYIALAEMYIKQYRYEEAREILEKVGRRGSENQESTKTANHIEDLMKTCNRNITAWGERKKKMCRLLEEAEANYGGDLESGLFYFKIKEFEKAEKAYMKAIKGYEFSEQSAVNTKCLAESYYGLAHTYLVLDDAEKAVEIFENAIEIDPANPILYRDLGLIAFQNNNIEPAEIFFTKAIELAPAEAELYKPLADLYVSLGEKEKAIALYENAFQANPDNPVIQQDLAVIYKETIASTDRA